jgi:hypothetical protein
MYTSHTVLLKPEEGEYSFEWTRRQFSVHIACPMTINNLKDMTSHLNAFSILKSNDDAYDVVESLPTLWIGWGSRTWGIRLDALHVHLSDYCSQDFLDETSVSLRQIDGIGRN